MEKIKPIINNWIDSEIGKDILTMVIVILVGFGSFFLGRLSKESSKNGLKIEYNGQEASALASLESNLEAKMPLNSNVSSKTDPKTQGNYFASNRGQKYYPIGCSAGKSIKLENRIYFLTPTEAEKAGYELSSSCK